MIGTSLPRFLRPSPNIEQRKDGKQADILILHYTGMDSAERACRWLCTPESKVSCHYLVDEQGRIIQMVDERMRAWHAGESSWHGEVDINSHSIGIEIQNPGHGGGYPDFPSVQMEAVRALSRDICDRLGIAAQRVLAHSDIAPGRKIDPGEKFNWKFLHESGVGHWVEPSAIVSGAANQLADSGQQVTDYQAKLQSYGYGLEVSGIFDARTRIVTNAFQRHFRPARVDGIADISTVATLERLLAALPSS